jgi:hypothetical protein
MFKKILYIGSGDDLTPLDRFRSSSFVYIDPLPRNEYGYPYYYRGFYRKHFKGNLFEGLREKSFTQTGDGKKYSDFYSEINVTDLDSHSITFERDGEGDKQCVRCYLSTGIPENFYDGNGHLNEELTGDISECDTLFIKGHWPREEVMEYVNVPIHFIGAFPTYFPEDERDIDSNNTVISYLINNPEKFSSYSYMNESGKLSTFETYSEFYRHYRETI